MLDVLVHGDEIIDTDNEEVVEMIPKPVWCILKSVVEIQRIIPATSEFGLKHLFLALCLSIAAHAGLPNIILMMGDDHGWVETGYNGHPHVKTPVLDEMAATGLKFTSFHSAHSSCSPTRASFLTGRHPCDSIRGCCQKAFFFTAW